MGIILVKGDNVFKIDNELKSANIPRTVRFTEPLFEKLNKTAFLLIYWFCSAVSMRLTICGRTSRQFRYRKYKISITVRILKFWIESSLQQTLCHGIGAVDIKPSESGICYCIERKWSTIPRVMAFAFSVFLASLLIIEKSEELDINPFSVSTTGHVVMRHIK